MRVFVVDGLFHQRCTIVHAVREVAPDAIVHERGDLTGVCDAARRWQPDVLVVGYMTVRNEGPAPMAALRKALPGLRVLVVLEPSFPIDGLGTLLRGGLVDFVHRPLVHDLLVHRLKWLVGGPVPCSTDVLAALCDPDSGRIHAGHVADFMDIPMSAMAAVLERPYSTVCKTPAAKPLQPRLREVVALLEQLHATFDSRRRLLMWLNRPRPELNGLTPIEALSVGGLARVRGLLEH